jgi:ABC-type branched-subunit amino acid transport system substrate-binding protein
MPSTAARRPIARAVRATDRQRSAIGPISFTESGDLRRPRVALLRVRHGGGSDELLSTEGADVIRIATTSPSGW